MSMFEAYCDNCGESFDVGSTVYDGDDFKCPDCGYTVSATVDEDGMVYWNTFDKDGEQI
jgi:predicted nucleic acid-binding Zn ribbon protein